MYKSNSSRHRKTLLTIKSTVLHLALAWLRGVAEQLGYRRKTLPNAPPFGRIALPVKYSSRSRQGYPAWSIFEPSGRSPVVHHVAYIKLLAICPVEHYQATALSAPPGITSHWDHPIPDWEDRVVTHRLAWQKRCGFTRRFSIYTRIREWHRSEAVVSYGVGRVLLVAGAGFTQSPTIQKAI